MRGIYVNVPVKDLEASKRFYGELGFELNPRFSDENAAGLEISEGVYVMLLTEDFFRGFITDEIADTESTTEVINCISADSKAEVDDLVEKALAAGGAAHKPIMGEGPMYAGSFKDPDGHVWEVLYMEVSG